MLSVVTETLNLQHVFQHYNNEADSLTGAVLSDSDSACRGARRLHLLPISGKIASLDAELVFVV